MSWDFEPRLVWLADADIFSYKIHLTAHSSLVIQLMVIFVDTFELNHTASKTYRRRKNSDNC